MGGGSSDNLGINVINADFFSHLKPYKKYTTKKPQWQLDFLYPFNCKDNAFDGIFSEHVLEHFYIDDARRLLLECKRVLKSGGTLRIAVPSLECAIARYEELRKSGDRMASEAIRKLTQEYLHLSVWDYERLEYELETLGFVDIKQCSYKSGRDNKLLFDLEARREGNLYVEATKP